jgi:hypothetical protein
MSFSTPSVGTLVEGSGGTFDYTPPAAPGFATFSYTITDVGGKTDTAEVVVVVGLTLQLQITEAKGIFKPDTNGIGQYQAAYLSGDDLGRVYSNRVFDPTDPTKTIWTKDRQYVEFTVDVQPSGAAWPADARVAWRFTDADDPSNEDAFTHASAGPTLDPNDYDGSDNDGDGTGDNSDGNDNTGSLDGRQPWEEADAAYPVSGAGDTVFVAGASKVRFNVTDDGGDNFIVTAGIKLTANGEPVSVQSTGVFTVWKRVDVEYVKMASAGSLDGLLNGAANDAVAMARVELAPQAGAPRAATDDLTEMGANTYVAGNACDDYVTSAGEFTHEGDDGWFFAAAANYFVNSTGSPPKLYEGAPLVLQDAADGTSTLDLGSGSLLDTDKYDYGNNVENQDPSPEGYRVMKTDIVAAANLYQDGTVLYDYDPFSGKYLSSAPIISHTEGTSAAAGAVITYGATADAAIDQIVVFKLFVSAVIMWEPVSLADYIVFSYENFSWVDDDVVRTRAKGYSTPTQYNSMLFGLNDHGYPAYDYAPVQVYGTGALVVVGISPGPSGGLEGRTIVFTAQGGDLNTLIHEFGHAFGFHHICGNWDYRSNSDAGKCCSMHYDSLYWMLTQSRPRRPDAWKWGTGDAYYCEEHIDAIRKQNLEDVPKLGWGD